MVFGSLLPNRPRKQREKRVREMADALNALDYARVIDLVTEGLVVSRMRGRRTEGRDAFIEYDKVFRTEAGCPQVRIDDIIHHDDEVLVRGILESDHPDIGGPTMWRVAFDGELIDRIEITRGEKTPA